jgi:hypothetical protein
MGDTRIEGVRDDLESAGIIAGGAEILPQAKG